MAEADAPAVPRGARRHEAPAVRVRLHRCAHHQRRPPPFRRAAAAAVAPAAAADGPRLLRSRHEPAGAGRHHLRRAGHRWRRHRRRRGARRRVPGPAHGARRAGRLRLAAPPRSPRSSCTAGCATCRTATSGSSTRRCASASGCGTTRRTWCACCRSSSRSSRKDGLINPKVARALGRRDVDVRPHRRRPHRQAPRAAQEGPGGRRTCPRSRSTGSPARTSTTTPPPTTPASPSRWRAPRARPRRGGREPRDGRRAPSTTRRPGPSARRSRPTAERIEVRARAIVNAAGVWSRRRARAGRGRPPRQHPAGQGHPHHRARGRRCATTSPWWSRCPKDKRSVFVVPWLPPTTAGSSSPTSARPTPTTTAPSTTPSARADDVAYLLAGHQRRGRPSRSPRHDVVGTWAGLRPLVKAATSGRTADLSRRHKVAVSDHGVVTMTGGKLTTYREMAAGRRRRGSSSASTASPARLARAARPSSGCAAPRRSTPPPPAWSRHLADRYGAEARVRPGAHRGRPAPRRAARARPPLRAGRGGLRRPPRDGHHRRRRPRPPHPRPAPGARQSAAVAADAVADADRPRARVVRRRGRAAGGRLRRRSSRPSAPRRACPPERSRPRGDEPVNEPHALPAPGPGAPTPPIALRDGGAGRHGAARWHRSSPVPPTVLERLRRHRADHGRGRPRSGEASRDWWPLAMIWALDGQVAASAAAVVQPTDAEPGGRDPRRVQRGRRARHGRRRAQRASAALGAGARRRGARPLRALRHRRRRRHLDGARRPRRHLRRPPRARSCAPSTGSPLGHWPQSMALSTVGGWLACRSAGQLSGRYGKIEDMVLGLDVVLADGSRISHRRRAARGGRARPQPALRRLRGHARVITGPACASTRPRPTSGAPPTASPPSTAGSTPCGGSSSAARTPPCCASTTGRGRSHLQDRRPRRCCSCSTRATPPSSTRPWGGRRGVRRTPIPRTSSSSPTGSSTATTSRPWRR